MKKKNFFYFFNSYEKSGNLDFITNISKWTFQEKKVLKVVSSKHHKVGETERPEYYTIKNNIVRSLTTNII